MGLYNPYKPYRIYSPPLCSGGREMERQGAILGWLLFIGILLAIILTVL